MKKREAQQAARLLLKSGWRQAEMVKYNQSWRVYASDHYGGRLHFDAIDAVHERIAMTHTHTPSYGFVLMVCGRCGASATNQKRCVACNRTYCLKCQDGAAAAPKADQKAAAKYNREIRQLTAKLNRAVIASAEGGTK